MQKESLSESFPLLKENNCTQLPRLQPRPEAHSLSKSQSVPLVKDAVHFPYCEPALGLQYDSGSQSESFSQASSMKYPSQRLLEHLLVEQFESSQQ